MKNQCPRRVFIVDDSPVVRERLARLLSEIPGVDIVGQADLAFEAIHSIRKARPEFLILDISMPGGSGIHVLETLRREKPSPVTIMLTNFAHDQYRQKCLSLGADYFFDKSSEFDQVLHVLSNPSPRQAQSPAATSGGEKPKSACPPNSSLPS